MMQIRPYFFGLVLFVLPLFSMQCSGFEVGVFDGKLEQRNERILLQREAKKQEDEIIKSRDMKRIQALIDEKPWKIQWRITRAVLEHVQGNDEAARQTLAEARDTLDWKSDVEAGNATMVQRIAQVRDTYPRDSNEYKRGQEAYCRTARSFNEENALYRVGPDFALTGC
jgi:hypothetical protein